MIDIAVLTCNRKRIHEISLREIRKRTLMDHRLIVCDNGSEDGTPEMLTALKAEGIIDELILLNENTGVHWGHNVLLEHVGTQLYVSADGDLIPQTMRYYELDHTVLELTYDWLEALETVFLRHYHTENYAAIACRPHVMIGDSASKMFESAPVIVERAHVGAVLRLMRTEAVRAVGGWKQVKRPSRNGEERYICGKLRKAGWKVGYARDVRAIHLFGKEEFGEDPWGYPEGSEHGHRDVWPPVNHFGWERLGVNWETCSD